MADNNAAVRPAPAISVVVPTRDGSARLPRLLAALAAQDTDTPFGVVVVDDGSVDDTHLLLRRAAATAPWLRVLRLATPAGPAAARNAGWRATSSPLIAFTDDDCTPHPGWLRALEAVLTSADIVQGRTEPDPDQDANRGPFSHLIGVEAETGYYETCNMAYRRGVLETTGGFDEGFVHPYGEDTDLAWRAKAAGATSAFAPEALVFHDVIPQRYRDHLRRLRRREGMVRVLSRHPELRSALGLGLFFRPTHAPALAVTVASAASLRRPSLLRLATAAGAAAWYARTCRWNTAKPPRRAAWAAVVPMRLAADLYEIVVLARASARHRTVLL